MGRSEQTAAMKVLCLLVVCFGVAAATFEEDAVRIAEDMFVLLEKDADGNIGQEQLNNFFKRYDDKTDNPEATNIFQGDFVGGRKSWTIDFNCSAEVANACFKLMDVIGYIDEEPDFVERITGRDVEVMVLFSDDDFDGVLNQEEFLAGFKYLLCALPFAVQFLRYKTLEGSGFYDEAILFLDYFSIYNDMDLDDDLLVTAEELVTYFREGEYGLEETARLFHSVLDVNQLGVVTADTWLNIGYELDYLETGALNMDEFLVFDFILYNGYIPLKENLSGSHSRLQAAKKH